MEAVFCNELILEKIFHYLSTSDLLLRVNQVALNWKQVATKLVKNKRQILLHNDNILKYVDSHSSGGVVLKNIKLKLYKFNKNNLRVQEETISAISTFGQNVKKLDLLSCTIYTETDANLMHQILFHCKNVESLSIVIGTITEYILKLFELQPLSSLKFLDIGNVISNNENYSQLILAFLNLAPNLQVIHFSKREMNYQFVQDIEAKFPGFIQKIGTLRIFKFCAETAQYLLSENLSSLKIIQTMFIYDVGGYVKVLEKYADQLVKLEIFLVKFGNVQGVNLPVMRNLETLRIAVNIIYSDSATDSTFRFWNYYGADNIFPNLVNLELAVETVCAPSFFIITMLEMILFTALPDVPSHPIFPNVKRISIIGNGVVNYEQWLKPEMCSRIKKYFPNVAL